MHRLQQSSTGLLWLLAGGLIMRRLLRRKTTLQDKVVIVTGASAGIGRATVRVLAAQGAKVVLAARREAALNTVKEEIAATRHGPAALVVPADITDEAARQQLIERTLAAFGRVDVLVNNAGLSMGGPLDEQDSDTLLKMLDLNFTAAIRLTQIVLPHMLAQNSGHIVNISSVAGYALAMGQSAYAGTKAGLNGFSHALRRDLLRTNVNVSIIAPGWTYTDMMGELDLDAMREVGLLWPPFLILDTAEVVAKAITDAVRYNRAEVMLGGVGFKMIALLHRLSPRLSDLAQQIYFRNHKRYMDVIRTLG
jgi:short-subunit dehydrogenase